MKREHCVSQSFRAIRIRVTWAHGSWSRIGWPSNQVSPCRTFAPCGWGRARTRRFSRGGSIARHRVRRLVFVSAMTLTQRVDGEAGTSYLELVDLLQSRGVNTHVDCLELFRRVVFSILIHNTDDHLRNHGFFIGDQGISLSPAFDLNPSVERRELTLAINEIETACDVSIAMDAHLDYGLSATEADEVLEQVSLAVTSWREEAARLQIPRSEQDLMAAAFNA